MHLLATNTERRKANRELYRKAKSATKGLRVLKMVGRFQSSRINKGD